MKAVLWVDTFQSVIMLVGVTVLIALGMREAGGIANVWTVSARYGRANFFQ